MRKYSGMTLIELLIAITIGIIMTAAVIFLFIESKQSYRENEDIVLMQENARFSLQLLSKELRHAGFYGGILRGDIIEVDSGLSVDSDCRSGWLKDIPEDIDFTGADETYTCLDSDKDLSSGTLEIRSVLPEAVDDDTGGLKANHFYIRTNITSGCIWKADGPNASPNSPSLCPTGSGFQDWELVSNLYYISTEDSDNPRLCRKQIDQGNVKFEITTQCLTDGIERFHIEFGIDESANGGDGIVDRYTATLVSADLNKVVSARIYLLARSARKNAFYTNKKEYHLGSLKVDALNDNYKRRVYSTTVLLRNIVNLRKF